MRATIRWFLSLGVGTVILAWAALAAEPEPFNVLIQREKIEGKLITGSISVNGEKIGTCYENLDKKIPAGTFPGKIRTTSMRNHAQGPGGVMGNSGDFLLEITNVVEADGRKRTDILLHLGNKPEHSLGCVLLGPPSRRDPKTKLALLDEGHPLRVLRKKYFGSETPKVPVNRPITVTVNDPPK
ncbi:DUF5675 family protein [Tuwongella immobilis]|uniref:DUF5675 domain-containing protein n=1 Tax=Tuwongella immobilis TaxID=692036 RepID=A0A6C2YU05_9BACT|nr:DUF5675 family protein [Tuwongella immobilis]VIP05228.1 unnamed protein product [Tuwongella immobilis]VTS07812.1 unnamed protein product [Tuwongella immobilis]